MVIVKIDHFHRELTDFGQVDVSDLRTCRLQLARSRVLEDHLVYVNMQVMKSFHRVLIGQVATTLSECDNED